MFWFFLFIVIMVATATATLVHAWQRAEAKARKARIAYRAKLEEDWYEAQARQVQLFIR